jgi:hypothetical protein
MNRVDRALSRDAGLAAGALLASSATSVCCVLPAVLVALMPREHASVYAAPVRSFTA